MDSSWSNHTLLNPITQWSSLCTVCFSLVHPLCLLNVNKWHESLICSPYTNQRTPTRAAVPTPSSQICTGNCSMSNSDPPHCMASVSEDTLWWNSQRGLVTNFKKAVMFVGKSACDGTLVMGTFDVMLDWLESLDHFTFSHLHLVI